MATFVVLANSPADESEGVPLRTAPTITLEGVDFDEENLKESMFLEGPDTDQYVGPGQLELIYPQNVSQGEVNDFLQSPGYQGIVAGEVTVVFVEPVEVEEGAEEDLGSTILTFTPSSPLVATTVYHVNLTGLINDLDEELEGFFSFQFTSGSASLVEVPDDFSVSDLSLAVAEGHFPTTSTSLEVVKITPADHSIENPTTLNQIVIEFNKPADLESLAANLSVTAIPATGHPSASTNPTRTLAYELTADGNKVYVRI